MNKKVCPVFDSEVAQTRGELGRRVFVGLSGGVDSAVSAALLKAQGYDVTGVFIKVWHPFDEAQGKPLSACNWREERRDAMRVALKLDIPFLFFDFETEYKKGVADYMIEEYKKGRTPNPDVLCNREIKFGAFWKKAKEMGADYIATGHYANIAPKSTQSFSACPPSLRSGVSRRAENVAHARPAGLCEPFLVQYSLREGKDKEKDQSYFLWTLTEEDLSHTLFPVGGMLKSEVRRKAEEFGLSVAKKKDSQGICFMGDISLEEFLSHFTPTESGNVLNTNGEVIGKHRGALYYTIGERHGFDVLKKGPEDGAFYVVSKDMKANTITVSNKPEEIISRTPKKILLDKVNWINEPDEAQIEARVRYRQNKLPVELSLTGKKLAVTFKEPLRGLSLGQSIVFYRGDQCLGGAVMDRVTE